MCGINEPVLDRVENVRECRTCLVDGCLAQDATRDTACHATDERSWDAAAEGLYHLADGEAGFGAEFGARCDVGRHKSCLRRGGQQLITVEQVADEVDDVARR